MMSRSNRVRQILKNAGVIQSSDDESDSTDIIENTPRASPNFVWSTSHSVQGVNFAEETARTTTALSPVSSKTTYELGETSIEAPKFSPLTPLMLQMTDKNIPSISEVSLAPASSPFRHMSTEMYNDLADLDSASHRRLNFPIETGGTATISSLQCQTTHEIGETSIEAPTYSPLTPLIQITDKNMPCISPASSPLRPMSSELRNFLADLDSDDSVQDPTYVEQNSNDLSNSQNINESPSILTTEECHVRNTEVSNEDQNNPKKRKVKNPNTWKRNVEKIKRLKGESYATRKGNIRQARPIKPAKCSSTPKHKCIIEVPQDERVKIYTEFRTMPNLMNQRHFVVNHVIKNKKKRDTTNGYSRRNFTLTYTFTVGGEKKVVCREFFLDTLNITGGFVKGALGKLSDNGHLEPENRGKKTPPNKLKPDEEQFIREHILSFPAVESHYCRRDSTMKYLDSTLNITMMYNEYKKQCEMKTMKVVSFEKYRKIFREYKLSFHKPKKDLCKKCVAFKEMNDEEKAEKVEEHTRHLSRRDEARKCRDEDKLEGQTDETILSFNFDLEAVLNTPKGASGPFFYVRKLAVYNLTIYNLGNQNVDCYMWEETEGKRGTFEISTCINAYIAAMPNISAVKMMSDGCGGQQKNYHFSAMCLLTVQKHPKLQIIDHKFFETGHTHMECDSIHSKIETKSKNVPVYTPDGWAQIIGMARTNPRPFKVTTLLHDDFKDFGMTNQYKASDGKIGINEAVRLQYRKGLPDTIFMKKTFECNEPFISLELKKKRGKVMNNYPKQVYTGRIPISDAKKKDLLKLCQDFQIPRRYHNYYKDLPSSQSSRDCLPEPDVDEDSD